MITEAYIKGRYDYGVGKCAVVIVEAGEVKHKVAWKVPAFEYDGVKVEPDKENCEIIAVCYALQWCRQNGRIICNVYSDSDYVSRWFYRGQIPKDRVLYRAYAEASNGIDVFADSPPRLFYVKETGKYIDNEFNLLVNELAEKVK
jgi:ribonuclease HI